MSSVDWGDSTEVVTGSESASQRSWSSRLRSSRLAQRLDGLSDVRARRLAALTLLVAYGLVIAAQWNPWFHLDASGGNFADGVNPERSIDATTALYPVIVPYYVGWTLIGMACGVVLFGRQRHRRVAAGVAAGALASQALVVLATWHDQGIAGIFGAGGEGAVLHSTRQSGVYLALAALVATAVALVVALRGRILPIADEEPAATAATAAQPSTPTAPADEHDMFKPSARKGVRAGRPWVVDGGVPLDDPAEVDGVRRSDSTYLDGYELIDDSTSSIGARQSVVDQGGQTDHSMYMRPRNAELKR